MKYLAALTSTVCALAFAPFSVQASDTSATKPQLVALGASVTFGTGLNPMQKKSPTKAPSEKAFPFLLGARYGMSVTDLGVPGWTSYQLLQALQANPGVDQVVSKANLVTIQIGGDDIYLLFDVIRDIEASKSKIKDAEVKHVEHIFSASYTANLDAIIQRIRELAPSTTILLYNHFDPLRSSDPFHTEIYHMFNADIALEAMKFSLPVANAYHAFAQNERVFLRPGDIHPTVQGQLELARVGETALASALKQKSIS